MVAALVESGRLDDAWTCAAPLMAAGEIDLKWIAISPWPKPMLARIEAGSHGWRPRARTDTAEGLE